MVVTLGMNAYTLTQLTNIFFLGDAKKKLTNEKNTFNLQENYKL